MVGQPSGKGSCRVKDTMQIIKWMHKAAYHSVQRVSCKNGHLREVTLYMLSISARDVTVIQAGRSSRRGSWGARGAGRVCCTSAAGGGTKTTSMAICSNRGTRRAESSCSQPSPGSRCKPISSVPA